jgi:hypothetical protein
METIYPSGSSFEIDAHHASPYPHPAPCCRLTRSAGDIHAAARLHRRAGRRGGRGGGGLTCPMPQPDRFIAACASWSDFYERAKALPTGEMGAAFERLTQLYLQTTPEYRTELQHVWTLQEVPPAVRKRLALPSLGEGIDFIARTRHGKYWAIQSKFRSQHDKPLTRKELGTFTSLAFNMRMTAGPEYAIGWIINAYNFQLAARPILPHVLACFWSSNAQAAGDLATNDPTIPPQGLPAIR